MALIEGCKHELELTIPAAEVKAETERAVEKVRGKAHLKGFRPGKAPASMIRSQFGEEIRQEVLEELIPRHLRAICERENLVPVSQPGIKDLHYHGDGDVHVKVEFEANPEIELKETRGLKVEYADPAISDADIDARVEDLRQSKAEFVNLDPRPAADGDHLLVSLKSIAGTDQQVSQDDINIEIGNEDTFKEFTEALRGAAPGETREAEISYPENYAEAKLAGKTVRFAITLKAVRRREVPEANDEFAKDLGDFQSMGELREEIRRSMLRDREYAAQEKAKDALVEKLTDLHEFPVPQVYVEQQVKANVENQLRRLAAQGVDVSQLKIDWKEAAPAIRERAERDVRASMLLEKVANVENIYPTQEEVDRALQAISRQERQPVAAVRKRMEDDGSLGRLAARIRTDKVMSFLFEHAEKEAPKEAPADPQPESEPAA